MKRVYHFYLSPPTRNSKVEKRFISKSVSILKKWKQPQAIYTDKHPCYKKVIVELETAGKFPMDIEHKQVKSCNNRLESDHGKLKRLVSATLGFKTMKNNLCNPKKMFEIMRMFKKGRLIYRSMDKGFKEKLELLPTTYCLTRETPLPAL